MTSWTVEEARSFLAATREDRFAFAWALLLTRGPRRGEVCGLRWDDVDFEGQAIRVSHTRVIVDGAKSKRSCTAWTVSPSISTWQRSNLVP
jgi:integrase